MMAAGASVNTAFASPDRTGIESGNRRIHRPEDGGVGFGRPGARRRRESKQPEKGENRQNTCDGRHELPAAFLSCKIVGRLFAVKVDRTMSKRVRCEKVAGFGA
jgi:hypothetical protein